MDGTAIGIREFALGEKQPKSHSRREEEFWRVGARAISKRMVRQLVTRVKLHPGELGALHVDAVLHLARRGHSGQILQLPGGVEVRRERDALIFRPALAGNGTAELAAFSMHGHLAATGW